MPFTSAITGPVGPRTDAPPLVLGDTGAMADFQPEPAGPCFCGSGRSFQHCCGSTAPDRAPPYGVFVFEDYLDTETAKRWTAFAERRSGQRLMVIGHTSSTSGEIVKVEDDRRVAERVDLGERRREMNELVQSAFVDLAARCTGSTLQWLEAPELMRYRPGGFYVRHADSQNMDPATRLWSKVIDRDLSLLLYLNDDYSGGELRFEKFNYRLRPRAGMAVLFPSDSRYLHTAETVTGGVRYAVVSWAAACGVPKVKQRPPGPAILLNP